ncbi:anti-sigma B factor antagonist [Streptomyces sp. 2231.1]|uniref:STAS domain-containing protein n=1 Tax=Streptomyces sp. 2231.1 TaxID=1855347 RepID=UPI0008959AE9|nr:STAS domain-containing protein [Streptomyces sp. 2231.1]SEE66720.1 anti-sigma B factor antagonist [Streptomyces sp. 2231.1]
MTDVTDTLQLTVQQPHPGLAIATVAGDVDMHTADTLRRDASVIIQQGCPHLVLDLSQVGFCDSAGLSALIGLWHTAQAEGGALRLASVPDRLMRMLTLTGVDTVLPVHATTAEALTTMTGSPSTSTGEHGSITRVSTGAGTREPAEVERTACDSTHHSMPN